MYLILPISNCVVFSPVMNFPNITVRKISYGEEQLLAWCISVLLFSVYGLLCIFMGAPMLAGVFKDGEKWFILHFLFPGKGSGRADTPVCVGHPWFNTAKSCIAVCMFSW